MAAEVWKGPPGSYERLLREVKRFIFVLDDAQREVVDIALVFAHQCGKRIMVAFLRALNEGLFVVHTGFLQKVRQ